MTYLMLYCRYDPDNFVGYRKVTLKATTREEADIEAWALLDTAWDKSGHWEYHIYEFGWDSNPKLHPPG